MLRMVVKRPDHDVQEAAGWDLHFPSETSWSVGLHFMKDCAGGMSRKFSLDLRAVGQLREVLELDGFISEHLRNLLYRLAFTSACIETWYINSVMAAEVQQR